jgi:hypothetical protein
MSVADLIELFFTEGKPIRNKGVLAPDERWYNLRRGILIFRNDIFPSWSSLDPLEEAKWALLLTKACLMWRRRRS